MRRYLYSRDRLKGKILLISSSIVLVTLIFVSTLINYSIQHLVMREVRREMTEEVSIFKEVLQRDSVDIDRELQEMAKLFSIVIVEYPKGITYASAFDFPKSRRIVNEYFRTNFGDRGMKSAAQNEIERKIVSERYFTMEDSYMMIGKLPKNDFFPPGSYIGIIKDISYLKEIKYTINIILGVILLGLMGLQIFLVNYAMERVLGALRELNDFTGNLYRKDGSNLSQRFSKRYGNKEVDKLIVTLNKLIENIETNIKTIEEFSSNVSHELKTPMASMKSMIEIDLVQERSTEEYKETLIKILEEINWMNGMIKELLNLTSNPENLKKSFKELDLQHLGNDICDIMEMIAMESEIDLTWDFEAIKDVKVVGDGGSIKQVIMNLINNSIKYNVDKGWIKVWGENRGNIVKIVIEDCGIGIKKENIERITERFFREDNVRTHKKSGVGLGLAIVKHILEIHSGYLEIESTLGKGSKFKICLPVKKD